MNEKLKQWLELSIELGISIKIDMGWDPGDETLYLNLNGEFLYESDGRTLDKVDFRELLQGAESEQKRI